MFGMYLYINVFEVLSNALPLSKGVSQNAWLWLSIMLFNKIVNKNKVYMHSNGFKKTFHLFRKAPSAVSPIVSLFFDNHYLRQVN